MYKSIFLINIKLIAYCNVETAIFSNNSGGPTTVFPQK